MDKTIFSKINYNFINIEEINHTDPKNLPYYDKDVEVLKNYKAYLLWENGKNESKKLVEEGIKAIQSFHSIINEKLKDISLKKSLEIGILSEPYYSLPRIHESIFEEINGNHSPFLINNDKVETESRRLYHGDACLAQGNKGILNDLKVKIESLINNLKIREEIRFFNEVKSKLDSKVAFENFKKKNGEINNDFIWNQKLRR